MPLLAITTFPDTATAETIAGQLLQERLVACVSLVPGVSSLYRWEGALERSQETLALLKTTEGAWPQLERRLAELHPYACPELIALPVAHGAAPYLQWLAQNCAPTEVAGDGPSTARPQT